MSLTKTILEDQEAGIDPHQVDRDIDDARQSNANDNRPTDYDKKVEAMQEYMAAIGGDGWEEMTSKEWAKVMAHTIHGLNGGELDRMENALKSISSARTMWCGQVKASMPSCPSSSSLTAPKRHRKHGDAAS